MLDFSFKGASIGFTSVQAETLKTDKVEEGGDLSSTLVMTSVGLLTTRLYSCKLTTDMIMAAAGGVAFLAGEVSSFLGNKSALKELEMQIERDRKGAPTQQQIALLEKLRKSYEEAKKTANLKKTFQQAAAAAFLAAAAVATYLWATETAAQQACRTAITTSIGVCSAACAACATVAGCACPTCCAAPEPLGFDTAERSAKEIAAAVNKPSSVAASADASAEAAVTGTEATASAACPEAATAQGLCKSGDLIQKTTRGVCMNPLTVNMMTLGKALYANQNYTPIAPLVKKPNIFETIFMQSAHADLLSPMGIVSSAAVSYVMMTSATLGLKVDTFMFSPGNRAIIWGVLAGLAFSAGSAIQNQIGKIDGNIAKIDAILNSMYAHANGVKGAQTPGQNNASIEKGIGGNQKLGFNEAENTDIDLKGNGAQLPCITGDDPNKCPSFSNKLLSQPDFKNMPDSLQATMSSVAKMTDGLNGTNKISSATISEASSLGSRANALKSDYEKRKKDMQDSFKKAGLNKDINKESSQLEKDLHGIVKAELDKRNMTAGQMIASFGGSKNALGASGAAVATDASQAGKSGKKGVAKGAIPVVAIPAASMPKFDDKSLSDSMKADQDKAAELASAEATDGKAGESIDDFDLKNDITKEKDTSIFDLISNRYQKSGYPRLFKRIK